MQAREPYKRSKKERKFKLMASRGISRFILPSIFADRESTYFPSLNKQRALKTKKTSKTTRESARKTSPHRVAQRYRRTKINTNHVIAAKEVKNVSLELPGLYAPNLGLTYLCIYGRCHYKANLLQEIQALSF